MVAADTSDGIIDTWTSPGSSERVSDLAELDLPVLSTHALASPDNLPTCQPVIFMAAICSLAPLALRDISLYCVRLSVCDGQIIPEHLCQV